MAEEKLNTSPEGQTVPDNPGEPAPEQPPEPRDASCGGEEKIVYLNLIY